MPKDSDRRTSQIRKRPVHDSPFRHPSFMLQGMQQLCITIYLTVLILFRGTTSYYSESNCRSCYSVGGRSPNSKCTQDMCSIYISSTSTRCKLQSSSLQPPYRLHVASRYRCWSYCCYYDPGCSQQTKMWRDGRWGGRLVKVWPICEETQV